VVGSSADSKMRLSAGRSRASGVPLNGAYARYVLIVLVAINMLNFVDRQILAILAEDIKADLHIKDAQLGFLFGTAFAVFYATFGLAFGRLADLWNRTRLIALGLSVWSLMTCMSGICQRLCAPGSLPLWCRCR
jgi:MFS family permease